MPNLPSRTAASSLIDTDLLYLARDPFGATDDRKIAVSNLYNSTNLKLTSGQFDTIQGISTSASPQFAGLDIGTPDTMVVNGATIASQVQFNSDTSFIQEIHTHNDSAGSYLYFARSRGSNASPTIVQSGDLLGSFASVGYDGTDYALSSQITFTVGGTPGANDMPGQVNIKVSPDGSQTPSDMFVGTYTSLDLKVGGASALTMNSSTGITTHSQITYFTTTQNEHIRVGAGTASSYSPEVTWYYNGAQTGYVKAQSGRFDMASTSADMLVGAFSSNTLSFMTNGSTRVQIASTGAVTVNTAATFSSTAQFNDLVSFDRTGSGELPVRS